jgi:beta-fructofuranosidase
VRAEREPADLSAGRPVTVPVGRHADVVLRADLGGGSLEVALGGVGLPLRPGADGGLDLRLLVDAGVVEVFSGGGVAVARIPAHDGDAALVLTGADGARLRHLVVHEMERLTG